MSKPANPTFIGAFVIASIALLLIAIALFSSATLFTAKTGAVILFEESVSGLHKGASVVFRGVPIGNVSRITLGKDINSNNFVAPVYINLTRTDETLLHTDSEKAMQEYLNTLFAQGLRARLAPQSILTGQLMIELDFFPKEDLPSTITNLPMYDGTPQIPAISSRLESIWKRFDKIPVEKIAQNIESSSKELTHILQTVNNTNLVEDINDTVESFQQISATMLNLTNDAQIFVKNINDMTSSLRSTLPEAKQQIQTILDSFTITMKETNALITMLQYNINPANPTVTNLHQTLYEVSRAAHAIRTLANTLERQPEMLIRGRISQP